MLKTTRKIFRMIASSSVCVCVFMCFTYEGKNVHLLVRKRRQREVGDARMGFK